MTDWTEAYLALGANLDDPPARLAEAVARLAAPTVEVVARSRLYRSAPLGPPGQPDYYNAAVAIRTTLAPHALLAHAQGVERAMGRVKTMRWGPRNVDVDLVLYGDVVIDTARLVIPHRELAKRRFVVAPLADLAPDVVVPRVGRTVKALLADLSEDDGLEVAAEAF